MGGAPLLKKEELYMNTYEVIIETMNPCGGSQHAIREIVEVDAVSPEAYVKENGRFPVIEIIEKSEDEKVIVTGDGKGYIVRYTFSE